MATSEIKTEYESKTERGMLLPCPRCACPGGSSIMLYLRDFATFSCLECDGEFTADELKELFEKWGPVLKWIDSAPVIG